MAERFELLRRLIAQVDARLLAAIDSAGDLDDALIDRIASLESTRGSLWRMLSAEEARQP